jgi:hypothetical protein
VKSNVPNFLKNLYELLSKLLFEDWPFFVEQGPTFFDNGEMVGVKHHFVVGVLPLLKKNFLL